MEKYIKCMCYIHNSISLMDCMTIGISIVTLIVTISIPIQIMKFQRYTALMSTYMSFDFAHAFQSVITFFYKDCECNVEKIPEKYKKRFNSDFDEVNNEKDKSNILHYQRRLLNDYFLELEMCRESSWVLRRKIRKDWTTSEAYVCKILVYMNKAVDEDPEMFMNISSIKYERMPRVKGMCEYLTRFYNALRKESRTMQL